MKYHADGVMYLYPDAGDPLPEPGTKVQLLTTGGVHVTGYWYDKGYLGWLPLPKRDKDKEKMIGTNK